MRHIELKISALLLTLSPALYAQAPAAPAAPTPPAVPAAAPAAAAPPAPAETAPAAVPAAAAAPATEPAPAPALAEPAAEAATDAATPARKPEHAAAARAFKPFHERSLLGRAVLLFENPPREQLEALGELGTPTVSDLFVAMIEGGAA